MLTADEVERFVRDGFAYLPEAFPRALADRCRAFLWRETGLDPVDPVTWTRSGSSTRQTALALATGHAGDVYLCHPFLIHAAQPHRGREPRFMAQPPLNLFAPLELRRADGACSPVELAVLRGLGSPPDNADVCPC